MGCNEKGQGSGQVRSGTNGFTLYKKLVRKCLLPTPFYFSRQCSRKKTTVEENIYAEAWFAELSSELFQTTKMELVEKIVDGF